VWQEPSHTETQALAVRYRERYLAAPALTAQSLREVYGLRGAGRIVRMIQEVEGVRKAASNLTECKFALPTEDLPTAS